MPAMLRLALIFGGRSAEHDISCVTAAHVIAAADRDRYELVAVGIDHDGRWLYDPRTVTPPAMAGADTKALTPAGDEVAPSSVIANPDGSAAITVVFPLLHGPYGEDGTVQGLLELADVPYVGTGVLGSALCMDKAMAKVVTGAQGIPQCRWLGFTVVEDRISIAAQVESELGFPCFVKPANLGSSVGISKAGSVDELLAAIEVAFAFDERVVIEEGVAGREIEVAVMGSCMLPGTLRTSVPGEIIPAHEFYDYSDKYDDAAAQLCIPAALSPGEVDEVRALAARAFSDLRCEGMARVDFFYEEGGRGWLLNEINTIPGFTPLSMYPKLFEASGLPYSDLVDELVKLALARHQRRATRRSSR